MRHGKLNKRFGRNKAQRKALMRSLLRALAISYRIETTVDKAKQVKRDADKLIGLAKKATLSDIRAIDRIFQDRALTKNFVKDMASVFKERTSGFTRVVRTSFRKGDGAQLAILELVEIPAKEKKQAKKKSKPAETAQKQPRPSQEEDGKAAPVQEQQKQAPKPERMPKQEKAPDKPKPEQPKPPKKEPEKQGKAPKSDGKKGLFGKFKGFFKKNQ